jgi:hypothetical protein
VKSRVTALAALAALTLSGCGGLDPFEEETLPPVEQFGVRITAGIGAAAPYEESQEITAPSTLQFRVEVADGNVVEVSMPTGPAAEIPVSVALEGTEEPLQQLTLLGTDGADVEVQNLYSFDPGFVAVEDNSTEDELRLRVATPRLTGTGQGAVKFTFKTDVPSATGELLDEPERE